MKYTVISFYITRWELEHNRPHLKPLVDRLETEGVVINTGTYALRTEEDAELIELAKGELLKPRVPCLIVSTSDRPENPPAWPQVTLRLDPIQEKKFQGWIHASQGK